MGDIQPLVALQADQFGAEPGGQHLGDLGLADARLALEQQRPAQRDRQVDGCREAAVSNVVLARQQLAQLVDRSGEGASDTGSWLVTRPGSAGGTATGPVPIVTPPLA